LKKFQKYGDERWSEELVSKPKLKKKNRKFIDDSEAVMLEETGDNPESHDGQVNAQPSLD
jgi:hypothetical protein